MIVAYGHIPSVNMPRRTSTGTLTPSRGGMYDYIYFGNDGDDALLTLLNDKRILFYLLYLINFINFIKPRDKSILSFWQT
jgi:hypothetical protein